MGTIHDLVRREFKVHKLNADGEAKGDSLAKVFSGALNVVEQIAGVDGREMSLVRTHMEIAASYARAAMMSRKENQADEPPAAT